MVYMMNLPRRPSEANKKSMPHVLYSADMTLNTHIDAFLLCILNSVVLNTLMYVCLYVCMYELYVYMVITSSKSKEQPGKVANPALGQLNRENEYFPVPVRAWEISFARRVRQSRPASACSSPYSC